MPAHAPSSRSRSLAPRVLAAGLVGTVCVLLLGTAWIFWRLGPDASGTAARVERDVRARFERHAETLARTVDQLRAQPSVVGALSASTRDQRALLRKASGLIGACHKRVDVGNQMIG